MGSTQRADAQTQSMNLGAEPGYPHGQQGYPAAPHIQPSQAATKEPKRWSTGALAAMLLAGAVLASGTTAVVLKETGNTSSFSSSNTSLNRTENASHTTPREVADGTVEAVAQKVLPSVVSIRVATPRSEGEGSGSIISNDGLIMTNNHVVDGAERGRSKIEVLTNDGRTLPATVVATDPASDIAVIKADGANDLQPISIGNSDDVQVGQAVVAVGSPLGLSATVTSGIVSAKNRPVQAAGERGGEGSLIDAIQTDAAINPGNSGGALVNMNGELVGIPSVIASLGSGSSDTAGSIGLGFAIPSNQAQKISRQLIDEGKVTKPVIGAQVNTVSDMAGAEIAQVMSGSPAEKAGVKDGDVVTKVNDRIVESGVGLIAAIRSYNVGDTVTLTLRPKGGGDERTVEVTLAAE
ncbi:S1C family serine protease [Corynebacterium sp. 319]|uniref:S1C family serine protease n=1 Tax=unclassified Corynebacterium TaxID=2624378 RepID=UPI00351AF8C7